MTQRVKKLLDQVGALTPEEQDELFSELVARLEGPRDEDVEDAWVKEITRRIERAKREESVGTDWEIVRARLERKLRRS